MNPLMTCYVNYLISEEVSDAIMNVLNDKSKSHTQKIKALTSSGHIGSVLGSSRQYFKMKSNKDIILDGRAVKIPHGIKVAQPSHLDEYHNHELFGKTQNKIESSDEFEDYRVIKPHPTKPGEYVTNPHGILAPVFHSHKGGDWLEMGHVIPFHDVTEEDKYHYMDDEKVPNVQHGDIINAVKHFEHLKHHPDHTISNYYAQILRKHKIGRAVANVVANTKMSGYDMNDDNWGLWRNPITGKYHPVILDYGADHKLLQKYSEARKNFSTGDRKRNLLEEFHPETQKVLDNPHSSVTAKMNAITRFAIGHTSTPVRGGTRYFIGHSKPKSITLDGHAVQIPYGTKIAIPHNAELGIEQNKVESSKQFQKYHVIQKNKDGSFTSNHDGLLVPVLHSSQDNHYHDMPRVDKMKFSDFANATRNEKFPNGMRFEDMTDNLTKHYRNSFRDNKVPINHDIMDHPMTQKVQNLIQDTELHPADLEHSDNWGIWTHPITKEKQPVILDYGFSKKFMQDWLQQ